jgi:hypothetical protein
MLNGYELDAEGDDGDVHFHNLEVVGVTLLEEGDFVN